MQYDIPEKVTLPVCAGETAEAFHRRLLMEAAKQCGLPLLVQMDFANYITITLGWKFMWKDKDESPENDRNFKDYEIKDRAGKNFNYFLSPPETDELKRLQIYYVLDGGVLGSGLETPANNTIIVDLNIVYDKKQFDLTKAQNALSKHIAFAELVYGYLNIKFYIVWTAGAGYWKTQTISEGRKESFVNIFLSISGRNDSVSVTDTRINTDTGEITTKDTFLTQGEFEGGSGLSDYSLREEALAHELGHKFGITAFYGYGEGLIGYDWGNVVSDLEINGAIRRLRHETVRKRIDWKRFGGERPRLNWHNGYSELILTIFDRLRSGARSLARKI